MAVNSAPEEELVVRQAYVVWQNLLYLPAFLEHPEWVREELALLAQGDPFSLESKAPADEFRRYLAGPGGDRHIRFVGRVVTAAQAPWTLDYLHAPASGLGHSPFAIEPSWRVRSVKSRHLPCDAQARCRLHCHLYPYGVANLLICTHLRFPGGIPVTDFVLLLCDLSPGQEQEVFTVQTPYERFKGGNNAVVAAFADYLAGYLFEKQGKAIWGQKEFPRSQGSVIQLIETDPPMSQDGHARQMRAMVTLRPNWQQVGGEKAQEYQRTDFGDEENTWVIAGGLQTVIYTARRARRKRQRFFWRLAAVTEFARIEAALYLLGTWTMQKLSGGVYRRRRELGERAKPAEWFRDFRLPTRVSNFWRDFPHFHSGLKGGEAAFYQKLAERYDTNARRDAFRHELETFLQEVQAYKTLPQQFGEFVKGLSEIVQGVASATGTPLVG